MEFKILDNQGKVSKKTLTASDAIFGEDFNEALIHKYRNNNTYSEFTKN